MEMVTVDHVLICCPLGYIDLSPRHSYKEIISPLSQGACLQVCDFQTVTGTLSERAASPVLRAVFLLPRQIQIRAPRMHANAQTNEFIATEALAFFSLNQMFVSHFH